MKLANEQNKIHIVVFSPIKYHEKLLSQPFSYSAIELMMALEKDSSSSLDRKFLAIMISVHSHTILSGNYVS